MLAFRRLAVPATAVSRLNAPIGQPLHNHLGQTARSASPDRSLAIARIAIAKDPATSNDRFVAATVARSTREAVTRVEKGTVNVPIRPTAVLQVARLSSAEPPFTRGQGTSGGSPAPSRALLRPFRPTFRWRGPCNATKPGVSLSGKLTSRSSPPGLHRRFLISIRDLTGTARRLLGRPNCAAAPMTLVTFEEYP